MFYSTEVLSRNLSDTHATADSVNSWVKNITENNLDKLIDDGETLNFLSTLFFWIPVQFVMIDKNMISKNKQVNKLS